MSVTRIGINGFGRIGRSVYRILADRDDVQVVAINDLFENQQLVYLLKYDSVMRVFPKEVTADDDFLYVDGQKIAMTAERDPAQIPWGKLGVDIVVQSDGEGLVALAGFLGTHVPLPPRWGCDRRTAFGSSLLLLCSWPHATDEVSSCQGRLPHGCLRARLPFGFNTPHGRCCEVRVDLEPEPIAPVMFGDHRSCARADERVEHNAGSRAALAFA
jgi:hypothetical protein